VEPVFNPRDVLVARRAADVTRAREVLGFEAQIPVDQGMAELIRGTD
jgi:UDP-glucose 4-epimerase